jgi:hypothetical protein
MKAVAMSGMQIGALVIAVALGYLAASSRFVGTKLCPKWWERFILSRGGR